MSMFQYVDSSRNLAIWGPGTLADTGNVSPHGARYIVVSLMFHASHLCVLLQVR